MLVRRYNAEIVAGALLPNESRILARLLLSGTSADDLDRMVRVENILQKRSPGTATRKAELICKRLETIERELLSVVAYGSGQAHMQALLVAAINHSSLIGDFLSRVIKERWRVFDRKLSSSDWEDFLQQCEQLDPGVKQWRYSTREKLGQVVRKCLVEAGYLESARNPTILPVALVPQVKEYLMRTNSTYVLDALESSV